MQIDYISSVFSLFIPKFSKSSDAINDKTLNETTSPIDAANGVAKLSGFM